MSQDRIVPVRFADGSGYEIRVGRGSMGVLGAVLRELKDFNKAVVISDENVGPTYAKLVKRRLEEAGYQVFDLLIPPGETSKDIGMADMKSVKISECNNRTIVICFITEYLHLYRPLNSRKIFQVLICRL